MFVWMWDGATYRSIYCLSSKFTFCCLICESGSRPFKYFSFAHWYEIYQKWDLEQHCSRNESFLVQVALSPGSWKVPLSPLLLHCSFSLVNACRTQLPPPIGHSLFSPALYLHSGWWLIWEPKQHRPVTCLGHCSCTLSSAPWGTYPETSLDWLSGKQITWLASHAEARASPAWLLLPRPASSAPHACAPGSQQLFLNARPELCTEVH